MLVRNNWTIGALALAFSSILYAQDQGAENGQINTHMRYDHVALQRLAADFVEPLTTVPDGGEVRIEAGSLDPRMAIRGCPVPANVELASNSNLERYATVEVSCAGQAPWRIYIPVRIYTLAPIVTATTELSPGTMLRASDLTIKQVDTSMIRGGLYNSIEPLIGSRVKRRIRADEPVRERNTCLVCEGELVKITVERDGMRVSAAGVALNDGLYGEQVAVRNQSSSREIQGTVAALNEVKIGL